MIHKLPERLVSQLQNMPESGMGYQLVTVHLWGGVVPFWNVVVLNGALIDLPDSVSVDDIQAITG